MRIFVRMIFAVTMAGLLAVSLVTTSDATLRSAANARMRAFDGLWSVSILTKYGDCSPAYRYRVRIWNGRVLTADSDSNYQVNGAVASSGAIGVTVSGNGQSASGYGRLARNFGRGVWRSANGECSGQWTAERRE